MYNVCVRRRFFVGLFLRYNNRAGSFSFFLYSVLFLCCVPSGCLHYPIVYPRLSIKFLILFFHIVHIGMIFPRSFPLLVFYYFFNLCSFLCLCYFNSCLSPYHIVYLTSSLLYLASLAYFYIHTSWVSFVSFLNFYLSFCSFPLSRFSFPLFSCLMSIFFFTAIRSSAACPLLLILFFPVFPVCDGAELKNKHICPMDTWFIFNLRITNRVRYKHSYSLL
jgi:hypothetical protein